MVQRLFLSYLIVEMAVVVALASTIGFGWTVVLLLATFVVGVALAGSQVKRHLRELQTRLAGTPEGAGRAVTDSALVALGAVLVVVPGLASSLVGALLLVPPTRRVARPLVAALAARHFAGRVPLITVVGADHRTRSGQGDYIDGEVLDVTDDVIDGNPAAVERQPD